MLQLHNLLKIQCHQDGNFNLQTSRTEEEGKQGQVSQVWLELFLVFQEAGPLAVDRTNVSDVSAVLKAQMCDTWLFCRALMGASM